MSCKNIFMFGCICLGLIEAGSVYPSIIWNPWNPLFACYEPKVNVRIGDSVNFVCPSDDLHFYVPNTYVNAIFENLYYLGVNEQQYKTCNATGMRRLLNCDASNPAPYKLFFRDFRISAATIQFAKGSTYYFIGTGFRTEENLSNLINGSCMHTDHNGKYRLRLQIYVCRDEDIDCNICKSGGCYYKGCNLSCTNWTSDGKLYKDSSQLCSQLESRVCADTFLGVQNETRFKKVPCPSQENDCTEWASNEKTYFDSTLIACYSLETRSCRNYFTAEVFNQSRHVNISCPDTSPSCLNFSSNYIPSERCALLTTSYCKIAFRGKFKEIKFTEVSCSTPVAYTATIVQSTIQMRNISTLGILPSRVNILESSTSGMTMNSQITASLCNYASIGDPELVTSASQKGNASSDSGIIIGLIVAVCFFFVIGIFIGLFASKLYRNKDCWVIIAPHNKGNGKPSKDFHSKFDDDGGVPNLGYDCADGKVNNNADKNIKHAPSLQIQKAGIINHTFNTADTEIKGNDCTTPCESVENGDCRNVKNNGISDEKGKNDLLETLPWRRRNITLELEETNL